jgi:hypothetical protein
MVAKRLANSIVDDVEAMGILRTLTAHAEATRQSLMMAGVPTDRFARIEGVADREPFVPANRLDPRNRRMSITLAWMNH